LRAYTLRLPPLRLQPSNSGRPFGVGLLNLQRLLLLFDENKFLEMNLINQNGWGFELKVIYL
jgi:hypothetical protein